MIEQVRFFETLQTTTQTEPQPLPANIIKCPDCPCIFFSRKDFNRHQNTFGHYSEAHQDNWHKAMQRRMEGKE